MSLIHQKLYMGDKLAAVDMADYLRELGDNLLDSFGILDERVQMEYQVEPLQLDVDTAIPLGLIINELLTNALKYAFPDGRKGKIELALWREDDALCLKVADDGVGEAGAATENSTSFGSSLVAMLSKKLDGTPEPIPGAGYGTVIRFRKYKFAG